MCVFLGVFVEEIFFFFGNCLLYVQILWDYGVVGFIFDYDKVFFGLYYVECFGVVRYYVEFFICCKQCVLEGMVLVGWYGDFVRQFV